MYVHPTQCSVKIVCEEALAVYSDTVFTLDILLYVVVHYMTVMYSM